MTIESKEFRAAAGEFVRHLESVGDPNTRETLRGFLMHAKASALIETMTGVDRTAVFNALVAAST
jgi:hypothetical protein